jgi:FKBP-type peptidyl-prolyl cis-trans isomerase FkpA
MKRAFLVLAAVLVSSCNLNTDTPNEPSDPATETFASGLQVDISKMTKTPGGAYYKDLVVGSGTAITGLPTVIVSYIEFLKDASVVGSVSGVTQTLTSMIPGLQEGMQGMKPNGERLIVVPSALAYGNSNAIAGVPANSTIVFDIIFKGFAIQ